MKKTLLFALAALTCLVSSAASSTLYVTGDGFGGWGTDKGIAMTQTSAGVFTYNYTAPNNGTQYFCFVEQLLGGEWSNFNAQRYNPADHKGTTTVLGQAMPMAYGGADASWRYEFVKDATYVFTVDTNALTFTLTNTGGDSGDKVENWYIAGDFNEWSLNTQFTETSTNVYEYKGLTINKVGEFKMATTGWSQEWGNANDEITANKLSATLGEGAYGQNAKLNITGTYDVVWNASTHTITFTKVGEGGGEVTPPTPGTTDWYITGAFDSWALNKKFTAAANGTYEYKGLEISVAGDFAVATTNWGEQWGSKDEVISDSNLSATLAKGGYGNTAALNITGTYNVVWNPTTHQIAFTKVGEGGGEVTPPTPGEYPELIITGTVNDWPTSTTDAAYIMSRKDNIYTITVALTGEFKIKENNGTWESGVNIGAEGKDELGSPIDASMGIEGENAWQGSMVNWTVGELLTPATYTITLEYNGTPDEPHTITISNVSGGEVTPPTPGEYPELIITGDVNKWPTSTTDAAYIMSRNDNVYTITVALTGEFKIKENNGTWESGVNIGAEGQDDLGTPIDASMGIEGENAWQGSMVNWSVGEPLTPMKYHITLEYDGTPDMPHTITIRNVSDAIDAVEATEAAVAAVYYNLQGQRVAAPEKGLYIVVRGNNIAKEIIR